MLDILYTRRALEDLDAIVKYLTGKGVNPFSTIERLKHSIEILADQPYIGVHCHTKGIEKDCRIHFTRTYAIVYRFQPRTNTIVIIDIFHQSVNYPGKV